MLNSIVLEGNVISMVGNYFTLENIKKISEEDSRYLYITCEYFPERIKLKEGYFIRIVGYLKGQIIKVEHITIVRRQKRKKAEF